MLRSEHFYSIINPMEGNLLAIFVGGRQKFSTQTESLLPKTKSLPKTKRIPKSLPKTKRHLNQREGKIG